MLTASGPRAGIRLLDTNQVTVVVLHYCLHDMDGEGVARAFQKRKPEVPVLMLSHKARGIPQTILDLIELLPIEQHVRATGLQEVRN